VNGRRRRRGGGELWSDRRALAYVRLEDARSTDLPRHMQAIERLCDMRGLQLVDMVVDVEGGAGHQSAPPGLGWALKRLAAGGSRVLAVARAEHVTGAFVDAEELPRRLRERGATLDAADSAVVAVPSTAQAAAPKPPAPARRSARRAPGVGPGPWARYVNARTGN
jgi:hypothetical protein